MGESHSHFYMSSLITLTSTYHSHSRFLKPMQIELISQLKGSISHQILGMIGVKEREDLLITIAMELDVQK